MTSTVGEGNTPFTRSSKHPADIEQTSSRSDETPSPGSNVGLGLAHSWSCGI